jgi:hypothetical protein
VTTSAKNKKGHLVEIGNVYLDNDPRSNITRELLVLDIEKDDVHGERAVLQVRIGGEPTGHRTRIQINRLGTDAQNGFRLARTGDPT